MALTFNVDYSYGLPGGQSLRIGRITFDALYVSGTGYTVTPANLQCQDLISFLLIGNLLGFMVRTLISGVNGNIRCFKTGAAVSTIFAECATNEAGLSTLVGHFLAIGK